MIKCPKCDGHGFELLANRFGRIRKLECDICNGKGYLPITNKEWIQSATTEQLAKFLRQIYRDGRDDYVGEWYEQTESDFVEWLKQPHQ